MHGVTAIPEVLPRRATLADVAAIVEVHRDAFPEGFLTRLGTGFLTELYRGFVEDSAGMVYVAYEGERLSGFAAGSTNPESFFRRLLYRRGMMFILAAVEGLVRHPLMVARKLSSAVFYRGDTPPSLAGRAALLSSIGVRRDFAGRGVGRSLLESFVTAAFGQGADYLFLMTDESHNNSVNRFYKNAGFCVESIVNKPGGRKMIRYVKFPGTSDSIK